jgi:hypothetical protein
MHDAWHKLLHWLGIVAHWLYGDNVDQSWGVAFAIITTVAGVSFFVGGCRSISELFKATDVLFSKERLRRYNAKNANTAPVREINWVKARKQQVRSLRFTIPFGLLVFGVLYLWFRESFALRTYFQLTAMWIVFMIFILRPWWIAVVIGTERKLVRSGEVEAGRLKYHDKSVVWAIRHYMDWGLQKTVSTQPSFIGLLRPLNPILWMVRLLRLRMLRPLLVCTFYAFFWPVTLPIGVFYLNRELYTRTQRLKPEWAASMALEPTYGPAVTDPLDTREGFEQAFGPF